MEDREKRREREAERRKKKGGKEKERREGVRRRGKRERNGWERRKGETDTDKQEHQANLSKIVKIQRLSKQTFALHVVFVQNSTNDSN